MAPMYAGSSSLNDESDADTELQVARAIPKSLLGSIRGRIEFTRGTIE
jgi:hypothetical protein